MVYHKSVVLFMWLCITLTVVSSLPASDQSINSGSEHNDLMASIYSDCLKKDSITCIKYKVFSYIDKVLARKDDIKISEGVTIIKTSTIEDGAPRSIESSDLDSLIFDRLGRFIRGHTVKVDLKGTDIMGVFETTDRNYNEDGVVESRGKKKKAQKLIGPLMMGLAIKAATLIPLALATIAMIAGKALLIGKIALVISTIIGLKKLLSQQSHVTYEVVSHPHHSSHSVSHEDSIGGHSGYSAGTVSSSSGGDFAGYGSGPSGHSSGWARSIPHAIAYKGQMPKASN